MAQWRVDLRHNARQQAGTWTAAYGATARRRRKRDERQRPTQRAVMPAGGGAWHSPRPRRRLALRSALAHAHAGSRACHMSARRGARWRDARRPCAVGSAQGLIPQYDGEWTPAAIGQARVVARMRERGHSLEQIRTATEEGRLAFGFLEELFPSRAPALLVQGRRARDGLEAGADRAADRRPGRQRRERRHGVRGRAAAAALRRRGAGRRASRWWRCSSSSASTARRWRGSPTPRCGSSISTSTSR